MNALMIIMAASALINIIAIRYILKLKNPVRNGNDLICHHPDVFTQLNRQRKTDITAEQIEFSAN